jgi:outer membrane protein OmpA-like peptidoglycan-associated protein
MATLHFNSDNAQVHSSITTDMSQWHTWGVIWTPTSVSYTLDGNVWANVGDASQVPHQPMTLDIQQQTWCDVAANPNSPSSCPTTPQSTLVDWVAEYSADSTSTSTTTTSTATAPTTTTTTTTPSSSIYTVRPFAANSSSLSPQLKNQIADVVNQIAANPPSKVVLTGYSDSTSSPATSLAISKQRAITVKNYLQQLLTDRHVRGVKIAVAGKGSAKPVASNATPSGRAKNRRVVATVN